MPQNNHYEQEKASQEKSDRAPFQSLGETILGMLNVRTKLKLWWIWRQARMTKTNWRTTLVGVLNAVVAVSTAVIAELDDDPNTVANWSVAISAIITAVAFFFAADAADVKSK